MTEATPTPELKTYNGQCHCGAFAFTIQIPELNTVTECNCSICFRKGYKWVFPGEGCFTVTKGENALKDYEFGPKTMFHKFCPTCGTGVMGKRTSTTGSGIGVNVRTLKDVDIWALKVQKYDGASMIQPAWNPPKYSGPEPSASISNAKIYTGSCHCGAVALALKTAGPLSEGHEEIVECDCSICIRNGGTLCYPHPNQVSITGTENITSYTFSRAFQSHNFCKICGVYVFIQRFDVDKKTWDEKSTPGFSYEGWGLVRPVNLRCLEGVEWDDLKILKFSLKDKGPEYKV